jgi:hypothetical protein
MSGWLPSTMEKQIVLSTMEAEYVALSTSCQDLFPIIDITNKLCSIFNLDMQASADLHIKIHKDNVGALMLGKLEPRQMTPCSKHYEISLVLQTYQAMEHSPGKNQFRGSNRQSLHKRS